MATEYKENSIKPAKGSITARVRKGRGNASGFGGECGRGHKGQKARSGGSIRPGFEGGQMPLYRRLPKKPGQQNINRVEYEVVNVDKLEKLFKDGDKVTVEKMLELGLVQNGKNVKVLGDGELNKKLEISAHKFSKSAIEKIAKVSGTHLVIS